MVAMHPLETSTLPTGQPWHSQTLQPGTPATDPLPEEAGNDESRIQPPRMPTDISVHRLPMEIWVAVCEALRWLDFLDVASQPKSWAKVYPELKRTSTNQKRPDPIITAVSILQLSQTCRYLHKVTSPALLKNIRLVPPSDWDVESHYLPVIQRVKSLELNSNQRLQYVRGFAVCFPQILKDAYTDHRNDLRNQICHLLPRFPNLRHLTIIGMTLDVSLMYTILTLPLEHLWLWDVEPDNPIADHNFTPTTTPRISLRSLVLPVDSSHDFLCIPTDWIRQLIGTAMQDLSIDANELVAPVLPVFPNLETLEVPAYFRMDQIRPSMLYGLLSKTPNLKEAAVDIKAELGDSADTIPALSHLERVVCHASWLPVLIPGRPVTTAKVLYDSQVRVQELFEILHKGSVPLRDLTLTHAFEWGLRRWSLDDLEPVARYLPELEILRLKNQDPKVDGLHKALFYISQLEKLRLVSLTFWTSDGSHISGPLDYVWQESRLREFLGLTKSPVLERVSFLEEWEWKLEDTGAWILWQGGRVVRSVSL